MQFHIENMTCSGCVRGVTAAIRSVDPAAGVDADPDTRQVEVQTTVAADRLIAALDEAGFTAVAA